MYNRHFCKDIVAGVEGTGLVQTAPPDVFVVVVFSSRTSCTFTFHKERSQSTEVMKATMSMIICDTACL